MLDLNTIMIGTHQPKSLGEFYSKVFDKDPDWADGGWIGFEVGKVNFTIGEHSEVKGPSKEPQRIIINLETPDVKKEFERIKEAGAKVIKEPYKPSEEYDMWICTFADPDGNYFQLASPWKE